MNKNYINEVIEEVSEYFHDKKEYEKWKREEKALEDRCLNKPPAAYKKQILKSKKGSIMFWIALR